MLAAMADTAQVHDRFKLFTGALDDAGHIKEVAAQIHEWAAKDKIAVKSVGAAVAAGKLIITIGYRDDEEPYEIELHSSKIGRVGELDKDEQQRFTRAIESGGMNWPPVLGHTLYVTKQGDLYLIVLSLVEKRED
jgi:hypothetical protein